MGAIVHYTACPVCNSLNITPLLTAKDYTVSNENFSVWHCSNCTLGFTQDVPDEFSIGGYYKSEDYISHSNTGKGLVNQLYMIIRKRTLKQKAKLVIKHAGIRKGKLLDVGCGIGAFLNEMYQRGWEISGTEPDSDARRLALKLYSISANEPAQLFAWPSSSFNAVTMWHVLEHVHELHAYMEQLKNLLNANGKLFIAVPNYTSLDARLYSTDWAAFDVPRHLYHFTPKAITVLVEQHEMKVVEKIPMWFDSFYISMLSSKYRNGETAYLPSIVNGLRSNLAALINKDRCSSLIYVIQKLSQ